MATKFRLGAEIQSPTGLYGMLGINCSVIGIGESHSRPVASPHQSVCPRRAKAEGVCDNDIEETRLYNADVR